MATPPAELAGGNAITRDLLIYAWDVRQTNLHPISWHRVLGHVPEGVQDVVPNFIELIHVLRRWEQPHDLAVDMKLRYAIVELLWRLRRTDQPCLSSIAVSDTVDDIHPCDGLLCTDCRRAA